MGAEMKNQEVPGTVMHRRRNRCFFRVKLPFEKRDDIKFMFLSERVKSLQKFAGVFIPNPLIKSTLHWRECYFTESYSMTEWDGIGGWNGTESMHPS